MKAELLDGATEMNKAKVGEDEGKVSAYTNSNFQAVNNSIMMDGECTAEDPGVHIEIVDCMDIEEEDEDGDEKDRMKSKGKKEEMKKKKGKKESLHEEKHLEGKEG
ncbi:uncharacterized protein A4U43_C02F18680 [Asparagus officinalis]|uniref:Uncharacterized protein n=1 Tax=Asparagus officinalis TaxID=4686 RepID=A0A5P1FP59_ASPOF|nr:uncharacterized protein LOC109829628 [Asparagus officinalis]ONK78430.1 uncharacterized protein A4U43_C02F18680 [Asparagus officinalis]